MSEMVHLSDAESERLLRIIFSSDEALIEIPFGLVVAAIADLGAGRGDQVLDDAAWVRGRTHWVAFPWTLGQEVP